MKILLVQTSFLGDTILSTPVIAGIKKIYPDCELWMMTTPLSSSLIQGDPLLKGVISFDKRNKYKGLMGLIKFSKLIKDYKFDKVYSLHKSFRTSALLFLSKIPERICFTSAKASFLYHSSKSRAPNEHDVLRNLSILKSEIEIKNLNTDMRLFPPKKDNLNENIKNLISDDKKYAVLVPGSAWATKMWDVSGYKHVAKHLMENGYKVILTGSAEDNDCCSIISEGEDKIINLAGRTSISEAIYLVNNAALVVCNDSMALHMASACKTPAVVIFCSTIPEFGYGPWNNKAIVVEKKIDCRPCGSHGKKTCPKGSDECMKGIPHTEVIDAIQTILKQDD